MASSYASNQLPNTAPYSNTFGTNSLDVRNTFHWDRLQYANLSTNYLLTGDLTQLQSSDYLNARMKHWLQAHNVIVTEVLSMERDPSPDAVNEGQKTWYDYAGKTNINYIGTQVSPLFVARVLPDGTTSFERTDRNTIGNALTNVSTYSIGANVYLRTNIYAYTTDGIDLITVTNALLSQSTRNRSSWRNTPTIPLETLCLKPGLWRMPTPTGFPARSITSLQDSRSTYTEPTIRIFSGG